MQSSPPEGKSAPSEPVVLAVRERDELVLLFERLARDVSVDPAKLRELVDLKKSIDADRARQEFAAAFATMQQELPLIAENGQAPQWKFAKHEDITAAVRPILGRHGFGLRHQNETLADGRLKITAILTHRNGHEARDEFICPADTSGSKNSIQAMGSTREYGRRYTTESILNIVTRGMDKDGIMPEPRKEPATAPVASADESFDNWYLDFELIAEQGMAALAVAFNKAPKPYQKRITTDKAREWAALKTKALQVKSS